MSFETIADRKARLTREILQRQEELQELDRYRYRTTADDRGLEMILRDDGYRIHFQWTSPQSELRGEWELWAEYKHCDQPRAGRLIADLLMKPPV